MFESFVLKKIENENSILQSLLDSVQQGEYLTRIQIINSSLSDFTKNYLLYDFNEKSSSEELISKISKSNKLYFNFTIRPKWTLQVFLFNNFESRPPNEIVRKLNLFTFYSFYTEAIKDFITDNFQIFITKGELTSIIDQTNHAIYNKLSTDINNIKIKNFFLQIFLLKYETESSYNLESTVPFSFIQIFLKDKSFPDLESKFNVIKGLTLETEISLKDIIKVLTDKYNVPEIKEPARSDIEKTTLITLADTSADHEKKIEIKTEPVKSSHEKEIVLPDKQKQEVNEPDTKADIDLKEKKVIEKEKIYSEQLIKADKESAVLADEETDITAAEKLRGLKALFNEKQMKKITSRIYGSDLIYMDRSLTKLSGFSTWKEASGHLKDVFKRNNVNLYDKVTIEFVNILNDHYKKKE